MYNPSQFTIEDPEAVHAILSQYPLAVLVTVSPAGLEATHLPLLYEKQDGSPGVLRGHMAKANPQWSNLGANARALAIFTGPQHYISPNWYPSKTTHGRVVPTWNYVAVHVQGSVQVIHDADWLRANVRELTAVHEAGFADPWSLDAAPAEFIENQLKAIVGIEMRIETVEGKCKASQNRTEADQLGVIAGLRNLNTPEADRMAEIVSKANRHR